MFVASEFKLIWVLSSNKILNVLCDFTFDENDYIRDFEEFKNSVLWIPKISMSSFLIASIRTESLSWCFLIIVTESK